MRLFDRNHRPRRLARHGMAMFSWLSLMGGAMPVQALPVNAALVTSSVERRTDDAMTTAPTAPASGATPRAGVGQAGATPSTPAAAPALPVLPAPSLSSPSGQSLEPGGTAGLRNQISPDGLETQGVRTYDNLLKAAREDQTLQSDNNVQVQNVRSLLDRLVPYALKWNDRAKNWQWEVSVIRSPEMNAICLPGGKMIINTAILDRLELNENETAVLMAHLMAHALREHARQNVAQWQTGLKGTAADAAGIVTSRADSVADVLLSIEYSADDETEADVIGADIASRAGFDPRAGVTLWRKVDWVAKRRRTPFTLAHPVSEKRIADLKKRQRDMLPLYAKAIGKAVNNLPPYRTTR